MADTRPRISSPEVIAYLEELSRLGIYGKQPGAVATWIIRQEIMRLIERGVLRPIIFRDAPPPSSEGDEEQEGGQ